MQILLTSFDPFGEDKTNSSCEVMKTVADKIGNANIVKLMVPTVFDKSISVVVDAIKTVKPDAVICLGQGKCNEINLERVAINIDDARIKDNEGNQPIDRPIAQGGPSAYFSTLPIKAMLKAISAVEIPAVISNSAGTFVCNHLMYGVLDYLCKSNEKTIGGFIHVPPLNNEAQLSVRQIADGLEAAIAVI